MGLGGRIADNKRKETYDQIPQLVPGAAKDQTEELVLADKTGREVRVYKALDADGNLKGWVLPAAGQGFADRIELLVGVDAEASTITGLFVLSQKETPGLGDYITEKDFRSLFVNKSTSVPLAVVTGDVSEPNEIEALSGATISSESVADIVNKVIENAREAIAKAK
jgi:electron transport complex protein RnfG